MKKQDKLVRNGLVCRTKAFKLTYVTYKTRTHYTLLTTAVSIIDIS